MSLTTDPLASYRSPRLLATLVTAGFVPYVAGSLYQLSLVWRGLGYARAVAAGEAVSEQEGTAIDAALEGLWMPQTAIWIVGIVLFLVWTYRVARNRDAFGEPGESPAWCVTSYFVPIANLWSPLTALQTVWIGSDPTPHTDEDGDPIHGRLRGASSPLLVAWWVAWIASTILERISAGAADSDYVWWANITLVTVAVDTVALALMLRVVWALTHRQDERAAGGLARASIRE
jgi:hypothetical protein